MKSVICPSRKKWLFFAILWGSFVLLCSQFPYVSDDWVWGMDGRFSAFIDSFTDTNSQLHFYNTGRYLGNGLGFVAANHPVFRNIMMGTTLTLITALIASICATISLQKDELTDIFTALSAALLLLMLPKERFRQGIAWSSAFMIYVVGACFSLASLLIFLRLFRGQVVSAWACVLLPFLSAFFVENLSIGNVLFFGAVVVTMLLKRKTVSAKILLWGVSALAGLGIMLSDDGYRRVFSASQKAVYWSAPVSSLSEMIKSALRCLRGEMPGYLLTASGIWAVLMAFALFDTERKNGSSGAASAVCLGIGFYFLLRPAFQPALLSPTLLLWLDFLMMVIYFSLVAWNLWQHGRTVGNWFPLWTLGYLVLSTAPLFVAKPLSERVFMPAYTVQIALLCECLPHSTRSKRSIFALAAVFIALYSFLFTVYGEIHKIDRARVAYAQRRLTDGERVTMIPKLPHEDYVVVSYPYSGWVGRFTRFYEIEGKMDISVCELEEWLDLPDTPNY